MNLEDSHMSQGKYAKHHTDRSSVQHQTYLLEILVHIPVACLPFPPLTALKSNNIQMPNAISFSFNSVAMATSTIIRFSFKYKNDTSGDSGRMRRSC